MVLILLLFVLLSIVGSSKVITGIPLSDSKIVCPILVANVLLVMIDAFVEL